MKCLWVLLFSFLYVSCECCRPDIKLGKKVLDPATIGCLPASTDTQWTYINQRYDTLRLKCYYLRDTSYIIAVDFLCQKGFDSQVKYWNCEHIDYQFMKDSFSFYGEVTARTDRLTVDTMLFDYLYVSMNGMYMYRITSMRNMDTTSLDPDDYRYLEFMNTAGEIGYVSLNGKIFRNVFYATAMDTTGPGNALNCRELYYSKGTGIIGFKLYNGDLWTLDR